MRQTALTSQALLSGLRDGLTGFAEGCNAAVANLATRAAEEGLPAEVAVVITEHSSSPTNKSGALQLEVERRTSRWQDTAPDQAEAHCVLSSSLGSK